jgi:hypothetical protein
MVESNTPGFGAPGIKGYRASWVNNAILAWQGIRLLYDKVNYFTLTSTVQVHSRAELSASHLC